MRYMNVKNIGYKIFFDYLYLICIILITKLEKPYACLVWGLVSCKLSCEEIESLSGQELVTANSTLVKSLS